MIFLAAVVAAGDFSVPFEVPLVFSSRIKALGDRHFRISPQSFKRVPTGQASQGDCFSEYELQTPKHNITFLADSTDEEVGVFGLAPGSCRSPSWTLDLMNAKFSIHPHVEPIKGDAYRGVEVTHAVVAPLISSHVLASSPSKLFVGDVAFNLPHCSVFDPTHTLLTTSKEPLLTLLQFIDPKEVVFSQKPHDPVHLQGTHKVEFRGGLGDGVKVCSPKVPFYRWPSIKVEYIDNLTLSAQYYAVPLEPPCFEILWSSLDAVENQDLGNITYDKTHAQAHHMCPDGTKAAVFGLPFFLAHRVELGRHHGDQVLLFESRDGRVILDDGVPYVLHKPAQGQYVGIMTLLIAVVWLSCCFIRKEASWKQDLRRPLIAQNTRSCGSEIVHPDFVLEVVNSDGDDVSLSSPSCQGYSPGQKPDMMYDSYEGRYRHVARL